MGRGCRARKPPRGRRHTARDQRRPSTDRAPSACACRSAAAPSPAAPPCGSIFASSAQRLITMCHGFSASRNSAVSAKPLPPMRRATSHMSGSVSSPISSIGKRSVNLAQPEELDERNEQIRIQRGHLRIAPRLKNTSASSCRIDPFRCRPDRVPPPPPSFHPDSAPSAVPESDSSGRTRRPPKAGRTPPNPWFESVSLRSSRAIPRRFSTRSRAPS